MNELLSYTIDSPFFTSKIDSFTSNTEKLTDFIKHLIRHMRHLCKDIKQCSKTAETLGIYMKNNIKTIPNMSTILTIIQQLGDFFTEYANSNEILASSLESSFSEPLELFHLREISSTLSMIQLYRNLKETGETAILRYLQSDVANFGRGLTQHQIEQRAYDIVQHKRRFEIVRFDLIQKINDVEAFKNYEFIDSCASSVLSLQTHFRICQDKLDTFQSKLLHFQQELQKEKTTYLEEEKPMIRKRRDLTNVLDAMVERVEIASPFLNGAAAAITEGSTPNNNNNNNNGDKISTSNVNNEENGLSSSNYNSTLNSNSTTTANNNNNNSNYNNNNNNNNQNSNSSSWQSISRIGVSWGASLIGNLAKQSQQIIGSNTTSNDMSTHSHHATGNDIKSRRSITDDQSPLSPTASNITFGATCEECEARMKALDSSELIPLYQPSSYGELRIPGVIKQGFLWKRNEKSKLIEQWKRLWFVLDETKLYYIIADPRDHDSYHTHTVCDLMLASVRERKGETELPFSFEVAFANFESTVVQAEGQKEYKSWITELRNTIANRLTSGEPALVIAKKTKQKHSTVSLTNFSNDNNSPGSEISENRRKNTEHVLEIFQNNLFCAECEKESPEWISLNLGCLVCIDCSGVHRSLGVHISKMRSLKLDDLEVEEYMALKEVGNNLSNSVWEASVPSTYKKPDCNSSYSEREKFIRAKYEQRLFLNPSFNENLSIKELLQWKETLLKSCEDSNYYNLLNSIAHHMNLNLSFNNPNKQYQVEQNNNTDNNNTNNNGNGNGNEKYPLHIAIKHGSLTVVYFLIMNGFDIFQINENGLSSIEIAEMYDKPEILSYLRKRSELMKVTHQSPTKLPQQLFSEQQQQQQPQSINEVHSEQQQEQIQSNKLIQEYNNDSTDTDNIDKIPSLGIDPDDPFYDEDLKMI